MRLSNKIFIILPLLLLVAACAEDTVTQGYTRIGNPTTNEPAPTTDEMTATKNFIIDHPFWRASIEKSDGVIEKYLVRFNPKDLTATIESNISVDIVEVEFEIIKNGSIVPKDNNAEWLLSAVTREGSKKYPLAVEIANSTEKLASVAFFSEINEPEFFEDFDKPADKCKASEDKVFDDDDYTGVQQYFTAGSIWYTGADGVECGTEAKDRCLSSDILEEYKLEEYKVEDGGDGKIHPRFYWAKCDCKNSKCVSEITDEDLGAVGGGFLGLKKAIEEDKDNLQDADSTPDDITDALQQVGPSLI